MFETMLVVTQRDATTFLDPLQEHGIFSLTVEAGLPGARGPEGPPGPKGTDGQAGLPEIIDGGNF